MVFYIIFNKTWQVQHVKLYRAYGIIGLVDYPVLIRALIESGTDFRVVYTYKVYLGYTFLLSTI